MADRNDILNRDPLENKSRSLPGKQKHTGSPEAGHQDVDCDDSGQWEGTELGTYRIDSTVCASSHQAGRFTPFQKFWRRQVSLALPPSASRDNLGKPVIRTHSRPGIVSKCDI